MKTSALLLATPALAVASWTSFAANPQHTGTAFAVAASGTRLWQYSTEDYQQGSAVFSPDGKTVYMASDLGAVFALDVNTGIVKWDFKKPPYTNMWSTPAVSVDGNIYFGSFDGTVQAISSNGTALWTSLFAGGVVNTSPAMDANGNIYFGSNSGQLNSYTSNGQRRWSKLFNINLFQLLHNIYFGPNIYFRLPIA
jgi:outer membrane protein assembly factor BamB